MHSFKIVKLCNSVKDLYLLETVVPFYVNEDNQKARWNSSAEKNQRYTYIPFQRIPI